MMKKILFQKGEPVLNYTDFRQNFSPFEVYEQLDRFRSFSRIHIAPHTNREPFFRVCLDYITETTDVKAKKPEEALDELLEKLNQSVPLEPGDKKLLAERKQRKECLTQEMAYINRYVTDEERQKDPLIVLKLLVICHLACITPEDTVLQRRPMTVGGQIFTDSLPDQDTILLTTSGAHRYSVFASSQLPEGASIRTVRMVSQVQGARIELYGGNDTTPLQTRTLHKNHFIYANVCMGQIIKLLPTIHIGSQDNDRIYLMYRRDMDQNIFSILSASRANGQATKPEPQFFNTDASAKTEIYSFAITGNNAYIYIYALSDGSRRIGYSIGYFNSLDSNRKRTLPQLTKLSDAVELCADANGLHILTGNGTVYCFDRNGRLAEEATGRVSLNDTDIPGVIDVAAIEPNACEVCTDGYAVATRLAVSNTVKYSFTDYDVSRTEEILAAIHHRR